MRIVQCVFGILAVLYGAFLLFAMFAFATLVDPDLDGPDWWWAVVGGMLRGGMGGIAIGLTSLVAGIWLLRPAPRGATTGK